MVSKEAILYTFTVEKECTFWTNRKKVDALYKLFGEALCIYFDSPIICVSCLFAQGFPDLLVHTSVDPFAILPQSHFCKQVFSYGAVLILFNSYFPVLHSVLVTCVNVCCKAAECCL